MFQKMIYLSLFILASFSSTTYCFWEQLDSENVFDKSETAQLLSKCEHFAPLSEEEKAELNELKDLSRQKYFYKKLVSYLKDCRDVGEFIEFAEEAIDEQASTRLWFLGGISLSGLAILGAGGIGGYCLLRYLRHHYQSSRPS